VGGPVVIPNCVQIVLNYTQQDLKTCHNVLYGRVGGIPSPTVAQADAIFSALSSGAQYTALKAFQSSLGSFSGVSLRNVHTPNNPILTSTGTAVPGTGAGVTYPNEVAVVVTLRTANVGVQNRGRMYIPNWTSDASAAGNVVLGSAITALQNWANTIAAALSAQGYTWVIGQPARSQYTGTTGTVHPARAATSIVITSASVRNNTWDSQRRRGLR